MVPEAGIEPARPYGHGFLSRFQTYAIVDEAMQREAAVRLDAWLAAPPAASSIATVAALRRGRRHRRRTMAQAPVTPTRVAADTDAARSLLHLDARYGMNLVPADARRLRVMHKAARDGDMAADRRNDRMVVEPRAGGFGTRLGSGEVTNDFKHEVAALIRYVARVHEMRERRIDFQPTVGISVRCMNDAVRKAFRGGINDHSCDGHTIVLYQQSCRVEYVLP